MIKGIIFGRTFEVAKEKMIALIKDYEKYWKIKPIAEYICTNDMCVKFSNGDIWRVKGAYDIDSLRGYKCNIVLLDYNLSEEICIYAKTILINPIKAIGYYYS